ncbi:MAG: hypothetical protein RL434_258 [Pseudomonadota bacterium]|jgi:hypothetical protein
MTDALIHEAVITTLDASGRAHITPLGYRCEGNTVVLAPFVPSHTLDNLRRHPEAVLNFTTDVRVIAGALTGRREWPVVASSKVAVPRLAECLAHWELKVVTTHEDPERPRFLCERVLGATHEAFTGFNRAQAAVVELAILVSRLDWLAPAQVRAERSYLQHAVDKTGGPREREAWHWLTSAVDAHPRHGAAA